MSKILTLIPSKNRASQLELLVRSLKTNFDVSDICAVYTYSNSKFKDGYDKLIDLHNDIELIEQADRPINEVVKDVIKTKKPEFINFCTDDTVFFRDSKLSSNDVVKIIEDDVCSFSPRLGKNSVIQDYRDGTLQPPLTDYMLENGIMKWKWINIPPLTNYGYPSHQDGCIFNRQFFDIISDFEWKSLRSLEGTLALERRWTMEVRPYMTSPEYSFAVNIPTNNVQPGLYCGDKYFQAVDVMNDRFLDGERLALDSISKHNILGSHQEVPLLWV